MEIRFIKQILLETTYLALEKLDWTVLLMSQNKVKVLITQRLETHIGAWQRVESMDITASARISWAINKWVKVKWI